MDSTRAPRSGETALLNAALESMPYGFSIWDDDYRLVLFNRRYTEIYGIPPQRIYVGMSLLEICELTIAAGNHEERTPEELCDFLKARLRENAIPAEAGLYEKPIRGRTIKTGYGRIPGLGWVVTHEDITEDIGRVEALRAREAELRLQNMRLDAAVNNMPQGLSMFDADQRLVICNNNYARLYGLPHELTRTGIPMAEVAAHMIEKGRQATSAKVFPPNVDTDAGAHTEAIELKDGRTISVFHHPMPDGGWVTTHQDITEQRTNELRIHHLARHDTLTDLPNRLQFRETMAAAEARIEQRKMFAMLAIDLDHFKSVNDTLGHGVGDSVLKLVSDRLRASCRKGDVVARLGGDEFAVLTGTIADPSDAAFLAERIVKRAAEPFMIDGHSVLIGASVGIALAPGDGTDTETLMKNADLALYRSKAEGRGAYHFFEQGMDAALQERRSLEMALRQAIAQKEFRLVFQPLINLSHNRICGVEALIRWYHPERGTIPPAAFIPIAEETGLIVPIGEWVLREACAAAARWPDDINIAVNLSTIQFRHRSLIRHVKSALENSGLSAGRLELEVTESLLLTDGETTMEVLHELRELGVRISMDDFGTGYSSLSYLRSFPFDKIKIDQSFVQDLSSREGSRAIVSAVIGLGRSLGMATTAEGVETEAQLDLVRQQGCTEVQGFLFSPPLPPSAIDKLFAEGSAAAEWTKTLSRIPQAG